MRAKTVCFVHALVVCRTNRKVCMIELLRNSLRCLIFLWNHSSGAADGQTDGVLLYFRGREYRSPTREQGNTRTQHSSLVRTEKKHTRTKQKGEKRNYHWIYIYTHIHTVLVRTVCASGSHGRPKYRWLSGEIYRKKCNRRRDRQGFRAPFVSQIIISFAGPRQQTTTTTTAAAVTTTAGVYNVYIIYIYILPDDDYETAICLILIGYRVPKRSNPIKWTDHKFWTRLTWPSESENAAATTGGARDDADLVSPSMCPSYYVYAYPTLLTLLILLLLLLLTMPARPRISVSLAWSCTHVTTPDTFKSVSLCIYICIHIYIAHS